MNKNQEEMYASLLDNNPDEPNIAERYRRLVESRKYWSSAPNPKTEFKHPNVEQIKEMILGRLQKEKIVSEGTIRNSSRVLRNISLENFRSIFKGLGTQPGIEFYQEKDGRLILRLLTASEYESELLSKLVYDSLEDLQCNN
jgi:hypothetical protein